MYREYSIEIPYKEISDSIDNKIKEMLPSVELPGFRKGKAPLNIVKKKYENNVLAEVIENIAQVNTKKILEEKKLKPLRQQKVELDKYEKEYPFIFKLKIDLEPELNLIDFKKIKLNKYDIKIENKSYEENYNNYVKSQVIYSKINKYFTLIMNLSIFKYLDSLLINHNRTTSICPFSKMYKE